LGSFFIICGTFGLVSIVGIFSVYWQEHQLSEYSARDVGWIPAVNIFILLFLGVQIGPMFDRYGPRWLLIVGSVLNVGGLFILAECTAYWHFMLVYGVVIGTAGALLTTTALAVVAHWFERKRGLASGVVFVGSSVGGIVFPLVLRWAFAHLGWKWGIRILAFLVLVMMGIGNLTIRGRLAPRPASGAVGLKVNTMLSRSMLLRIGNRMV
jgi:MFS family permease